MPNKAITRRARVPQAIIHKGPIGEYHLPDNAGCILYIPDFLTKQQADGLFNKTKDAKSWQRTPIKFFGKPVLQPRDTAFFGTKLYSYSDERRLPTPWEADPPASNALKDLALDIERKLALPPHWFNVILANKYYQGDDFMGWHSDNEKSLGDQPIIASISLGAERRFLVRKKNKPQDPQKPREKIEYTLAHGSLLVMTGTMQSSYQHSLPKMALSKCDSMRLNFTYRRVFDESDQTKFDAAERTI